MKKNISILEKAKVSYVFPLLLFMVLGVAVGLRLVNSILLIHYSELSIKLSNVERCVGITTILLFIFSIPSMKKYFPKSSKKEGACLFIGMILIYYMIMLAFKL